MHNTARWHIQGASQRRLRRYLASKFFLMTPGNRRQNAADPHHTHTKMNGRDNEGKALKRAARQSTAPRQSLQLEIWCGGNSQSTHHSTRATLHPAWLLMPLAGSCSRTGEAVPAPADAKDLMQLRRAQWNTCRSLKRAPATPRGLDPHPSRCIGSPACSHKRQQPQTTAATHDGQQGGW